MSTIPRGQRRGEKRPLSVWRWSLILTRFQTVRCFSQIYFPENMFKFGNSNLYTYITLNISCGVFFPFWRSSPVMGNPPIHWKLKMSTYDEVVCQNDYRQTYLRLLLLHFSNNICFFHFTNHIRVYRNNLITVFTLLHLFLEKRINELYLIWTFVNFESYSAPFNFSYFSDGR